MTIDIADILKWKEGSLKTDEQILANKIIFDRYSVVFWANTGTKFEIPYGKKYVFEDDYFTFYEENVPNQWPTLFWEVFVSGEKYLFSSRYTSPQDIEKYVTNLFFYPPYAEEMKNIKTYVNIL